MTEQAKLVVSKHMGGSSGRGISYYTSLASCERRAYLNEQLKQSGRSDEAGSAATIGTIFHALMELYYGKGDPQYVIEVDDLGVSPDLEEAQRLFNAYRQRFAHTEWSIVGTEVDLPATPKDKLTLFDALGFEFTARLDMVVEISEEQLPLLLTQRPGLNGIRAGRYIVDHKTMSARRNDAPLFYRHSPQFIMYPWLWNFFNPSSTVTGIISNNVVRHMKLNENSFFSTYMDIEDIALSAPAVIAWLKQVADSTIELRNGIGEGRPNLASCDSKFGLCKYLINGMCNRI